MVGGGLTPTHSDTEFGGNGNLKGNVGVQEVRVVQSIQSPLVNSLETRVEVSWLKDRTDV